MESSPGFFTLVATGQLESAEIPYCQQAYCKFEVVAGEDWQVLDGMDEGITQVARQSPGPCRLLVWNFPIDMTYKATNAFGWPQVVVSVYGVDALGRDVIQGYGCMHLPTCTGRYNLRVRLYRPRSASLLQTFTSWLTGMPAEFSDPKFPSYGEGREVNQPGTALVKHATLIRKLLSQFQQSQKFETACQYRRAVTRVVSSGHVNIQVNIVTKDLAASGYADGSSRDQNSSLPIQL